MPHSMRGLYDCFDASHEVIEYYKRRRKDQHFIFSDKAVRDEVHICPKCGNRVLATDDPNNTASQGYKSNLCHYRPKTSKIVCMHYLCAWGSLFDDIFALADKLGI